MIKNPYLQPKAPTHYKIQRCKIIKKNKKKGLPIAHAARVDAGSADRKWWQVGLIMGSVAPRPVILPAHRFVKLKEKKKDTAAHY